MNITKDTTIDELNAMHLMSIQNAGVVFKQGNPGDKPHEMDAWRVTFDLPNRGGFWSTDYFTGIGHRKAPKGMKNPYPNTRCIGHVGWNALNLKPVKPKQAGVLYSLLVDASAADENFDDWCSNYGYSNDSIHALNTYKQCLEIASNLRKVFTRQQIEDLREILQDY